LVFFAVLLFFPKNRAKSRATELTALPAGAPLKRPWRHARGKTEATLKGLQATRIPIDDDN